MFRKFPFPRKMKDIYLSVNRPIFFQCRMRDNLYVINPNPLKINLQQDMFFIKQVKLANSGNNI